MNEQTASEIRYNKLTALMNADRLAKHPHMQAEAIADHYTAHANMALDLKRLCEYRRNLSERTEIDFAIDFLVRQIKQNHLISLGIALEWPVDDKEEEICRRMP